MLAFSIYVSHIYIVAGIVAFWTGMFITAFVILTFPEE